MLKLTRLNHHTIAVNPDHIRWVEASPDTTLCFVGGEKLIILESVEELAERFTEYQHRVRGGPFVGEPDIDVGPRSRSLIPSSSVPPPSLHAGSHTPAQAPHVTRWASVPPLSVAVPSSPVSLRNVPESRPAPPMSGRAATRGHGEGRS